MNSRREAARQFKEIKVPRGIFSFRCVPSGMTWVGPSRNLAASRNGILFSLRIGSYHMKDVQAEWNQYGEDSFDFLVLEEIDHDVPALLVNDRLKDRVAFWAGSLNARTLL